mgnify:CR=1 FL=1
MRLFLWVLIGLLASTVIAKLKMLASGVMEPRKPRMEAIDVALNGALLAWAAFLLAGS